MRTVALALPNRLNIEQSSEFPDWCHENDIDCEFTGLYATVNSRDPRVYHMIWNVTADDAGLVLVKLRWHEVMAETWKVNRMERAVAEMRSIEIEEKL